MTRPRTASGGGPAADRYAIRLRGSLAPRWAAWFDGLVVTALGDGTTLIEGPIPDQAALHGVLQRIRDLGLPLVSVTRIDGDGPSHTSPDAPTRADP
ncbi:MAG: hypothetical protein KF809_08565 [Chloroflexi bacterium]|nr:hypothetical protein [Chloroflexota bacterium]